MTPLDIAEYTFDRIKDSFANNTKFQFGGFRYAAERAEGASLVNLLGDENQHVRLDWLDMYFLDGKLPFELGWKNPDLVSFMDHTLVPEYASFHVAHVEPFLKQRGFILT